MTSAKSVPLPPEVSPSPEPVPSHNKSFWSSLKNDVSWAIVIGLVVFLIGGILDWLLVKEHEPLRFTVELSDAFSGLVAAALGFKVLQYYRERRIRLRQRLEVISDMNHHVRNALQVISLSAYSSSDREHLEAIRSSVNRIQWALRELLPKL